MCPITHVWEENGHNSPLTTGEIHPTLTPYCRRPMQATGRFLTVYEALAMLQGSKVMAASWYLLEATEVPVASVQPDLLPARLLQGVPANTDVWKASGRAVPRHPPRPDSDPIFVDGGDGGEEDEGGADLDHPSQSEEDADDDDGFERDLEALLEEVQELGESGWGEIPVESAPAAAPTAAAAEPVSEEAAGQAAVVEEAPPPPPPRPSSSREGVAPRRGAAITVQCEGGSISYYASKSAFEAVCENKSHGRCVMTRTCRGKAASVEGGAPKGGRLVGMLAAWLGHSASCGTKGEHWAASCVQNAYEDRLALRTHLEEFESGRTLASFERPKVAGEGPEPLVLDGYL